MTVLMNMEALEQKFATLEHRRWMLRGSGTWKGNTADVEGAIESIVSRLARQAEANPGDQARPFGQASAHLQTRRARALRL